jgi:hypothetical protein
MPQAVVERDAVNALNYRVNLAQHGTASACFFAAVQNARRSGAQVKPASRQAVLFLEIPADKILGHAVEHAAGAELDITLCAVGAIAKIVTQARALLGRGHEAPIVSTARTPRYAIDFGVSAPRTLAPPDALLL